MPIEVLMPQMGEGLAEGTVTKWLKRVGDGIELDEPLLEISTDKIDAEIPSPAAGILAQILVAEKETVPVNKAVALIESESLDANRRGTHSDDVTVTPTDVGQTHSSAQQSSTSNVGSCAVVPSVQSAKASPPRSPLRDGPEKSSLSSPFVRRIAREHGLNLSDVKGSGTRGRIRKEDLVDHLQHASPSAVEPPGTAEPSSELVFTGPTAVVAMTAMRRQIADHMVASRRTSAHVTTVFEVDLTEVVRIRERSMEEFRSRHGTGLNYTAFFVRATAIAIKSFPIFNASVEGTNIVYKRDVNIGVAVALESGLIVPVIKRADEKNLVGIALAVQDLAERARSKRLRVDDVQDGTFTVTNPGMFGSLFGSPIIHQPQVAKLAVGTIQERVMVRNNAIAIRSMAYLSLSYDHRIIDGALGAHFLARLKAVLENWNERVL
jgi:2-oxoglutarate dehydrogenase E2 component (dihydrolipoamide succinyltransferase)